MRLKRRLRARLAGALWGEDVQQDRDAFMISYWWDWEHPVFVSL